MSWFYLVLAGILEIGWPVGLKLAQSPATRWQGIAMAVLLMAASGVFLWLAQRQIPIGTAYAVWTGIGALGAAILGMLLFGESHAPLRLLSLFLIVVGIVGLKWTVA